MNTPTPAAAAAEAEVGIGERVELVEMTHNPNSVLPGTTGIVEAVDRCEEGVRYEIRWSTGETSPVFVPPDRLQLIDHPAQSDHARRLATPRHPAATTPT